MLKKGFGVVFLIAGMMSVPVLPVQAQFFFQKNSVIGEKARSFQLKNLKGEDVSLDGAREGGRAVLFFWATWCPHCRTALDKLEKGQVDELKKRGITLLAVNSGEAPNQVKEFFQRHELDVDVLIDQTNEVGEAYEITGLPTFVFINEDGVVRSIEHQLPMGENLEKMF